MGDVATSSLLQGMWRLVVCYIGDVTTSSLLHRGCGD